MEPPHWLPLRQDERIELLLTGINMPPGIDSIELARRAREQHPPLKVLFVSGDSGAVWSRETGSVS